MHDGTPRAKSGCLNPQVPGGGKTLRRARKASAKRLGAISGAVAIVLMRLRATQAATESWTGATSNWSPGTNWTGPKAPPVSGDSLVFEAAGAGGADLNNDLTGADFSDAPNYSFQIGGITFNADASAYVIGDGSTNANVGDVFSLASGTAITNNSANVQTINNPFGISSTSNTIAANNGNIFLGGNISGTGVLTLTGSGTVTFGGSNSYSGGTTLSAGVIKLTNASGLGSGALTVAAGAASGSTPFLDASGLGSGTQTLANNIALPTNTAVRNINFQGGVGNNLKLSGNITGGSTGLNLYLSSADANGIIEFSGNNTFVTATSVGVYLSQGGGIQVDNANALGNNNNAVQLNSGGLIFGGSFTYAYPTVFAETSAGFTMNTGANNVLVSSVITDHYLTGITKTGNGTLTFTAQNVLGPTLISAGTLELGNSGSSGSIGNTQITDNTALVFDRNDTPNFTNVITGNGTVTQVGTGTLILTGSNSYTGTTTISSGTLQIGNSGTAGAIGSGPVVNDSTLLINLTSATTLSSSISGPGSLTIAGGGNVTLAASNSYSGPTIISAGTLRLTNANGLGNGTLTVAGNAPSNGATPFLDTSGLPAGLQTVSNNIALPTTSPRVISFQGGAGNVLKLSGNITGGGSSASLYLTSADSNGIIEFAGNNTFVTTTSATTGVYMSQGGGIEVDNANALGNTSNPVQLNQGDLLFGGSFTYAYPTLFAQNGFQINTNANTVTISSKLTDYYSDGLTKTGSGTLALTGSGSSINGTTVSAGTLRLDGSASGTGAIIVDPGAAFGGNGAISSTVTLAAGTIKGVVGSSPANGGTITAGGSSTNAGTLTTANQTWNAADNLAAKIRSITGSGGTVPIAGTDNDLISATTITASAITTSLPFDVQLLSGGAAATNFLASGNYTFKIASFSAFIGPSGFSYSTTTGAITVLAVSGPMPPATPNATDAGLFVLDPSSFISGNNNTSAGNFVLELIASGSGSGGALDVLYYQSPEPGTSLLVLAGATGLFTAPRRQRRVSSGSSSPIPV